MNPRQHNFIGSVLLALLVYSSAVHASTADDMQALLEAGKAGEAYQLGQRMQDELGNPRFDFFYGIAAVNGGRASEGVLALERYLLNFPDNDIARMELARGYFLLNDDGRSREEFEAVLAKRPAADVAQVVTGYLDAIKSRANAGSPRYGFHFEASGGRDSNVISGVSNPNITLPVFGDITLSDAAIARADSFYGFNLGAQMTTPIRKGVTAFAVLTADTRQYKNETIYNQDSWSLAAGGTWISGANLFRLTLADSQQRLDQQRYRDSLSLSGDWAHALGTSATFFSNLQAAKFSYVGANAVRDADYTALTTGVRQQFAGIARPELDFSLSYGREKNAYAARQELSRDLYGAHIGLTLVPTAAWTFSTGVSYLKSTYLADDPLLLITRKDDYYSWDSALIYALTKQWTVRGEYSVSQNKSNLGIYAYKRKISQLKVRYDY